MKNETIIKLHPHIPFSKLLLKGKVLEHHSAEEKSTGGSRVCPCLMVPTVVLPELAGVAIGAPSTPQQDSRGHGEPARQSEGLNITGRCRELAGTGKESHGPPAIRCQSPRTTPQHRRRPLASRQSHWHSVRLSISQ